MSRGKKILELAKKLGEPTTTHNEQENELIKTIASKLGQTSTNVPREYLSDIVSTLNVLPDSTTQSSLSTNRRICKNNDSRDDGDDDFRLSSSTNETFNSSDHSEYFPDYNNSGSHSDDSTHYKLESSNLSLQDISKRVTLKNQDNIISSLGQSEPINFTDIINISNLPSNYAMAEINANEADYLPSESTTLKVTSNVMDIPPSSSTCYEVSNTGFLTVLQTSSKQVNTDSEFSDNQRHKKKKWVKVKRLPDLCYYCDLQVKNFARHIFRKHDDIIEVQKIMNLKPNDLSRKRLIAAIRKRGNHLQNVSTCVKPVKKSHVPGRNPSECVPCKHCKGYFRPTQLWRHVKNCVQNPGEKTKYSHKTDAHDALVSHLRIDQKLKETVFPRMRADKISLVAKKDILICKYGAQYLASHREKHQINVCSRKMRELAKIFIEIQKLHPNVKHFYDALQPIYFDSFVEAVKIVAGYDADKEDYASSAFAMNIATSLKECCSLAIRMTLKRKSYNSTVDIAELEANFKTFRQLLADSWKFEISSVAASCLNTRKWNRITIVPLASDLKIFRCYLLEQGNIAQKQLKTNTNNEKAYKLLLEVTYCRSMLLNRKRGGELQRIPLNLYQNAPMHQTYEEFNDAISQTEKILLKKFKRVVTRGKRDRGVPVLFSPDVQQHLHTLVTLRSNFVKKDNIYLFSNIHHDTPLTGYKVMKKHACLSGAKNPEAITSTRLRKHLATMSQIFELSPNDIEQLATFMGHTKEVHKQVYRLPDDVFQTAKIAKLLVLMESGKAGEFKSKNLDEIEINMDENILEGTSDEEEIHDEILEQHAPSTSSSQPLRKPTRKLVPWSVEQKDLVKSYFEDHIKIKKPPRKAECDNLKVVHPGVFDNKTWLQIKVFIQNIYSKKNN